MTKPSVRATEGTTDFRETSGSNSGIGASPGTTVGNGGVPGAGSGVGVGEPIGGAMSSLRRYQLPCDPGEAPLLNRK